MSQWNQILVFKLSIFKLAMQYHPQKKKKFLFLVLKTELLYQVTNAKLNKKPICFGSEQCCSFEPNSPVVVSCWVLVGISQSYFTTHGLNYQGGNWTWLQMGTKCPHQVLPGAQHWRRLVLWTASNGAQLLSAQIFKMFLSSKSKFLYKTAPTCWRASFSGSSL